MDVRRGWGNVIPSAAGMLALTAAAVACGKASRNPGDGGISAGSGNAGAQPSSAGQALGGTPPTTVTGGTGGCGPSGCGGIEANAGAGGEPPEPCDPACLDSVVSQPSDFGTALKSSWFLVGCKERQSRDCVNAFPCPNQNEQLFENRGLITLETFPIGGIAGRHYKLTFSFNAVVSAREYQGGKRDRGNADLPDPAQASWDGFHRDGEAGPSNYQSWKLTVFDDSGSEARHYFMNSFPVGLGYEHRQVYSLSYIKSIVVVGGGKVTYRTHGSNCHAIDNCDVSSPDICVQSRLLPNEPADVPLPAMYLDPADQMLKPTTELSAYNPTLEQPWRANLGHLTITKVEETDDQVDVDYP